MLALTVIEARPAPQTAAPAILFRLRIEDFSGGRVHAIALRCQTRIEAQQRRYAAVEQARLYELFGDSSQWHRTLQGVTWAYSSLVVPSFERRIDVDLTVPCTYDLEVACAKYLHAIRAGHVPLLFLFSGTVFRAATAGGAGEPGRERDAGWSIEPVSWDVEAAFRMPAAVWHSTMDLFFPGDGWLRLHRETIDRLLEFRGRHAVVTWDEAIDLLLQHDQAQQPV